MTAIWIVGGIALVGVVALGGYAVGLRHKVAALRHEIAVLQDRGGEFSAVAARLELPSRRT